MFQNLLNKRTFFFKSKLRVLVVIFFGILLIQSFASEKVQARSFDIEDIQINAEVLPDASMKVTEKLTINFSGQWNGFYINIPQGSTPIEEVTVSENGEVYKFNSSTEYGPPGTFLVKRQYDKVLIDWSINAKDQKKTFDVSYKVVNAVKVHNDVAELYRKFIGDENKNKVGDVKVILKLPVGAEKYKQGQDIRIWGHGPLQGEVNFTDTSTVVFKVKNLPTSTFVEGRVIMPRALFPNAPSEVHTGKSALSTILSEEEKWAKDANRQRWIDRMETGGTFAIPLGSIFAMFFLWRKYGKAHPVEFQGDYYRELPGNYSPAELSVLWNNKKIKGKDLTATILDLARRKFLRIEEEYIEVKKFFGSKDEKTYRITFLEPPKPADLRKSEEAVLREHESELIDYLRNTLAEGREFIYLYDIEKYAKDKNGDFYEFWQQWTAGINAQADKFKFFDHSGNMPFFTVIGGLALFITGSIFMKKATLLGVGIVIAGAIFIFVPKSFKRRSPFGQEDYVKWQAFRCFLMDFSQMDKYEIPSLIIWEHYLVYAVTLGVAREVIKQLELVFPNMQDGDYHFGYGWYTYGHIGGFNSMENSFKDISDSIDDSIKSAQAAVSKSSYGSGGGGGFSSGGGGGGGGSSYGGR